ncbi:MAG: 4Fe-4S dicluster domain-containing protein [Planctomycetes bacterium]|jgi:Fe-S-cluster-containing hydrogenase component 2|nr:4Fe-4S dicluster domain-containing protein [Planctomycetota bacterium]
MAKAAVNGKRLIVTPDRCTSCRTCELACSFRHGAPNRPAVPRLRTFDFGGPPKNVILTCFQCDDAACVRVCPVTALVRSGETGAIVVLERRCIGCGSCAVACPFGQIEMDPVKLLARKCDLCGGDPACAAFCPTKALEYR